MAAVGVSFLRVKPNNRWFLKPLFASVRLNVDQNHLYISELGAAMS